VRQYPWIAGVMWDIVEFAKVEGLTSIERAVVDAILEIEPETGPDPRGRIHCQQKFPSVPETFRFPRESTGTQELKRSKPLWKQ